MLIIKRYSAWTDSARGYKIILDGEKLGKISDGEKLEFPISEGEHKLTLKIDWCRSKTIYFNKESKNIEFECGTNIKGWKILLGFIYLTVKYNDYIAIEQTTSPTYTYL
jgi:hypothetical protein